MARQLIVLALVFVAAFATLSSAQSPISAPASSPASSPMAAEAPDMYDAGVSSLAPESYDAIIADGPAEYAPASAPEADVPETGAAAALKVSAGIGATAIVGFMLL